jgi:hypothetical protein
MGPLKPVALLLVAALSAHVPANAGFVQGVVLDDASGRPLARAMVRIQPVPAANQPTDARPAPARTMRAGVGGQFSFGLPEGLYLLTVSREAYFTTSYGSRKPLGRGAPIVVTRDSTLFAELRMRRKGGLTGHVWDENGVPMPGIPVIAYRSRLPLRSAGTAVSDDRGIYRIGGLEPGKYWVRSAAQKLNDGSSWLPLFGLGTRETSQAKVHTVGVDGDAQFADISPEPGQLFSLSGLVACEALVRVTITLSSEAGPRKTEAACGDKYRFDGLAPAAYELSGVSADGSIAGFLEVFLDRDNENGTLQFMQAPLVDSEVVMAGSTARVTAAVKLIARRQNLSETDAEGEIRGRAQLVPGYWEFRAEVPPGMYVDSISVSGTPRTRAAKVERPLNAFDGFIPARQLSRIRVALSDKPGRIAGRVMNRTEAVPGVPVFLLPVTASASRSLGGARETLSDSAGRYAFENLPPGDYRVVASLDVNDITDDIAGIPEPLRLTVAPAQAVSSDVPLWVAP